MFAHYNILTIRQIKIYFNISVKHQTNKIFSHPHFDIVEPKKVKYAQNDYYVFMKSKEMIIISTYNLNKALNQFDSNTFFLLTQLNDNF